MLQAELKILGGKHQGKLIPLNTKKFLVGREQDCHLRPNSDLVSRHHCVFSIDDYAIRLRDLGSTNGTMVNGVNLRGEVSLKSGDRVTIGKLDLEVVIRQSVQATSGMIPVIQPVSEAVAAEAAEGLSTVELIANAPETETSYEIASFTPAQPSEVPLAIPPDTAILGTAPFPYQQPGMPGYPPGYPQMMPPGYPMPGYMPPQYPQYPPGYGQMPGYGVPPMGYPMGYPQMMPMQQGYPGMAVAAPPEQEEAAPESDDLAVKLPNPDDTGAKPAAAAPGSGGGAGAKKEEKPSNTAADIIKQYMNRRT
jgi:predicted component of type VI protein secretion system